MGNTTYRNCQSCGTSNQNRDYCKNCGAIININLKRKLEREARAQKKRDAAPQKKNKVTLFFERAMNHSNPLIKWPMQLLYSVWLVVLAIGSFLALLFSYIAA